MNRPNASSKRCRKSPDSSGILLLSAENDLMLWYNLQQFQLVTDEFRYSRNSGIFRSEQRNFSPEQRNSGAWNFAAETGPAGALF
jgi:hypothetical protein